MADTTPDPIYSDEFNKIYRSRVVEDIRELGEATQRTLLRAWPLPLTVPGFNLSGVDSAVVVLRRIFAELPAASHCRGLVFGRGDKNAYGVGKEEVDRLRALFRYAWHYLPDLNQRDPANTVLPLEVMDRQRDLLDVLLPGRQMDQSRISFEALMESEVMQAAFWGRPELQPFCDVTGWQEKGTAEWQTRQRGATPGPIAWKRDRDPSLEDKVNKMLCLREIGDNTTMLLPNWPTFLRVKVLTAAPITMDAMMEQRCLALNGFRLLPAAGDEGKYRLAQTENKYYLAGAVAMRSSHQPSDVVVVWSETGMATCPLSEDPRLGPAAHQEPHEGHVMVNEAMLYYVLSQPRDGTKDVPRSGEGDEEGDPHLTDAQRVRERLRRFEQGPDDGLTPLSKEAEEAISWNIAPGYALAEEKFFG